MNTLTNEERAQLAQALPRVNLNGDTRAELVRLRREARAALKEAQEKLAQMYPHGRNYQTAPWECERAARALHEERLRQIGKLINALHYEMMCIQFNNTTGTEEDDDSHTNDSDDEQIELAGSTHRIRCYDNGGVSADRYTVIFIDEQLSPNLYVCVGMSANPFHPQGFAQHSVAQPGSVLGQRVSLAALPADCRLVVMGNLALPDRPVEEALRTQVQSDVERAP